MTKQMDVTGGSALQSMASSRPRAAKCSAVCKVYARSTSASTPAFARRGGELAGYSRAGSLPGRRATW